MNIHIVKESKLNEYYRLALADGNAGISECALKADILGYPDMEISSFNDIEEVKKKINVGECILLEYDNRLLPFQCVHKRENGNVVFNSYYVVDNHIFDENTNVWRDASIRKYMNEDLPKKFDPEFLKYVKTVDVHTDDYVTQDKFYLLSHEEINYEDKSGMFKKNAGTEAFDYYKTSDN